MLMLQKQLDDCIFKKYQIEKKTKKPEKILAFLVEISELAEETCCYKYWNQKVCAPAHVILDKYVSALHFLLSIALDFGVRELEVPIVKTERPLTEQFLKVFSESTLFLKEFNYTKFISLITQYVFLGKILGFTREEIQSAYIEKNGQYCVKAYTN